MSLNFCIAILSWKKKKLKCPKCPPIFWRNTSYIYMYVIKYVFQRLNALDLRITSWEGGELSYPARPQNQSRESHPNLTSQAGSGGAVTQRQLWLAWVEPGGTTPTPTWTKAAPRELVAGKLWDDMEGLEVLVRAPCHWFWNVLATLEHICSLQRWARDSWGDRSQHGNTREISQRS